MDAADNEGCTALMIAADRGHVDALERLLRSCSEAERTVLRVGSPEPAAAVQRYELQALGLSPLLGGHELVAAGMVEGPALGAALSRVRSAQLQGEIASRQEALALLGLEPSEEP